MWWKKARQKKKKHNRKSLSHIYQTCEDWNLTWGDIIWATDDKQPNSLLVIKASCIVNICFITSSDTRVCYFERDSCDQNWSVCYGEAANLTWQMLGRACRCFLNQANLIDPPLNPSWWSHIDSGLLLRSFFDSWEKKKKHTNRLLKWSFPLETALSLGCREQLLY